MRQVPSSHLWCNIIAMVFWDARGLFLVDFLPEMRQSMLNVAQCCNMLDRLTEAVLPRSCHPPWQCDTPHSLDDHTVFEQYGWKVLQHPPHSPDPAPSYFHLFGHPKWSSSEQQFHTEKNVDASWSNSLYASDTGFFVKGFDSPFSH